MADDTRKQEEYMLIGMMQHFVMEGTVRDG
jgi:hypothetical protein